MQKNFYRQKYLKESKEMQFFSNEKKIIFTVPLCDFFCMLNRPQSPDAWQFANTGITKALGIMAFGNASD